jgi:hypothetical protein
MVHTQAHGKEEKAQRLQRVVYTVWNIWNERCRWVFDNRAMQASQLLQAIKDDVNYWNLA